MQSVTGNQRPDLLTSLMNMSFVLRLPREMHLSRSSSNVHACHCFENATKPSRFAHFWQGAESFVPAMQNDIWTSKSAPNPLVFYHFWLGNVLRATTDISTSKSALELVCFVQFDLEMCFAPQDGTAPAALASLLFDPPEPQIIQWFFLFSDLLSSLFSHLLSSLFSLSLLSSLFSLSLLLLFSLFSSLLSLSLLSSLFSLLSSLFSLSLFSLLSFSSLFSSLFSLLSSLFSLLSSLFSLLSLSSLLSSLFSLLFSLLSSLLFSSLLFSDSCHLCFSICPYSIAFGTPAGHREVAPRDFDVHPRWKPEEKRRRRRRRMRRIRQEDKAVKRKRLVWQGLL